MTPARTRLRGFTLIELMVVVMIVGLLSALAYPAYQEHILRTHRAVAAACLQELALQMERRYTISQAYDQPTAALPNAACVNAASNRYPFGFGTVPQAPSSPAGANAAPSPTASAYLLQATPVGAQSSDTHCGTLRLDQRGLRTLTGSASDVQSCWR